MRGPLFLSSNAYALVKIGVKFLQPVQMSQGIVLPDFSDFEKMFFFQFSR